MKAIKTYNVNNLLEKRTLTIKIQGVRNLRFRLWIIKGLLNMVAWVSPYKVKVDIS
jgi:hypothetical protein